MPAGWEWAILVLIALLLFGGARLPGIGRNAGVAVRTFRDEFASFRSKGQDDAPQAPAASAAADASAVGQQTERQSEQPAPTSPGEQERS